MVPQEPVQKRIVEEIFDVNVPRVRQEIAEVVRLTRQVRFGKQGHGHECRTTGADAHNADCPEERGDPQKQPLDKTVDMPALTRRQVHTVHRFETTAEVPKVQFMDNAKDIFVCVESQGVDAGLV